MPNGRKLNSCNVARVPTNFRNAAINAQAANGLKAMCLIPESGEHAFLTAQNSEHQLNIATTTPTTSILANTFDITTGTIITSPRNTTTT
eukprot:1957642-Pyramimonas_sp.AAC.1